MTQARDIDPRAPRLERFLAQAGEEAHVVEWRSLGGGRSSDTALLRLSGPGGEQRCVMHLQVENGPLMEIVDVRRQFAILRAMEATPVPAPLPLWYAADPEVLGAPFFICSYIPGEVPNPWRAEGQRALAEHRPGGPLAESFVRVLADIHAVPVDAVDLLAPDGDSPADRERRRWAFAVGRAPAFRDDPVLAYADGWLAARRPAAGPQTIVHGDYRPGNLVVAGESIVGVLDWELAEMGDPMLDIGTVCSPPLETNGLAAGLWEPDAFVTRYEEVSGRAVDRDVLDYFRVLSTYKVASLWANASRAFSEGAGDLMSLRSGYSVLELRPMLARTLGLSCPAPARDDRPAAVLYDALRKEVLPRLDKGRSSDTLIAVLAVLRGQRRVATAASRQQFDADVRALWRNAAETVGVAQADGTASARLARLARLLLALPGFAARAEDPLHVRLRDLVGRSAAPEFGEWP